MTKLIKAQAEYIKFLEDYLGNLAVYLHIHQMDPSEEELAEGERLRENIAKELK